MAGQHQAIPSVPTAVNYFENSAAAADLKAVVVVVVAGWAAGLGSFYHSHSANCWQGRGSWPSCCLQDSLVWGTCLGQETAVLERDKEACTLGQVELVVEVG